MAEVTDDPLGIPHRLPDVDVLEVGKLTFYNMVQSSHFPLLWFSVASGAVSIPDSNPANQNALHSGKGSIVLPSSALHV